jgi:hypothetical protein
VQLLINEERKNTSVTDPMAILLSLIQKDIKPLHIDTFPLKVDTFPPEDRYFPGASRYLHP